MSISPFFSGRIPQELYDKADEYCKKTGKKKTELLIEALSAYLNFPIKTQATNFAPQAVEVTKEMFDSLQEQVNRLEQLLNQFQPTVIEQDMFSDNNQFPNDNNQCDNNSDDKTDNDKTNSEVSEDSTEVAVIDSDNTADNKKNQEVNTKQNLVYDSITSAIVTEKTGLKKTQIDGFRAKIVNQYKKQGKPLTPKSLLEKPEEVKTNKLITVDNNSYQIFYLGQNEKGQNLWSLKPNDNSNYQPVITQLNYASSDNDNINYQLDNKTKSSTLSIDQGKNLNFLDQESVAQDVDGQS